MSDFLANCNDEDLVIDALTSLEMLRSQGNQCSSVVSEALGHRTELLSLKARAKKVRIRMLYFFRTVKEKDNHGKERVRRQVIFVNVLTKKKRALTPDDWKVALRRKTEIEREEIAPDVVNLPTQPRVS